MLSFWDIRKNSWILCVQPVAYESLTTWWRRYWFENMLEWRELAYDINLFRKFSDSFSDFDGNRRTDRYDAMAGSHYNRHSLSPHQSATATVGLWPPVRCNLAYLYLAGLCCGCVHPACYTVYSIHEMFGAICTALLRVLPYGTRNLDISTNEAFSGRSS